MPSPQTRTAVMHFTKELSFVAAGTCPHTSPVCCVAAVLTVLQHDSEYCTNPLSGVLILIELLAMCASCEIIEQILQMFLLVH